MGVGRRERRGGGGYLQEPVAHLRLASARREALWPARQALRRVGRDGAPADADQVVHRDAPLLRHASDPELDVSKFVQAVANAQKGLPLVFDPISQKMKPWIDMRKLEWAINRKCGKGACAIM